MATATLIFSVHVGSSVQAQQSFLRPMGSLSTRQQRALSALRQVAQR